MKRPRHLAALLACLSTLTLNVDLRGNLLVDPSFEDLPIGTTIGNTFIFTSTGSWTADEGSIQGAENGIVPLDGAQMLRFDEDSPGQMVTNIYQLVDLSPFEGAIATQQAEMDLSAFFNAPSTHDFYLNALFYEESQPYAA